MKFLSVLLTMMLAMPAFAAPKVVLIHGEQYYGSEESIPTLAKQLTEKFGYETTVLTSPEGSRALPDLDSLKEADLLVLYIRLRDVSESQLKSLNAYLESGKPAIALRTTSHGLAKNPGWFVPHFGGHFKSHTGQKKRCEGIVPGDVRDHPILQGCRARFRRERMGSTIPCHCPKEQQLLSLVK